MPIDPRISLGVQPLQVADPMARYSQLAGIQNAQNQNALAQYQLSAAQRADEQQNKLYAAAQQPDFKLDFQSAIQYGAPGIAAYKAQQEASNAQTEGQIKSTKLLTDKLSLLPEAYKRADTPEAYLALHQSIHADPVLGPYLKSVGATPEKGMAQIQNAIQTGNFEKLRMGSMQSVSQILDSLKPMAVAASSSVYDPQTGTFKQAPAAPVAPKETDLQLNYKAAKDQGFVGTIFDYEKKLKEAGRAPAQPRAEQPPVAVVDPVTGKQVYVTREQALSGKMTPASAMEGLAPKEIQAREAKFPAATSAVKSFESSAEKLAADLEKLSTHPGLSGISGLVYGRTPAITKEARAAQALYDSILARGGFQELQNMRAASPTGGALGNVSNQEGQYLRDAFGALNRTQDTADLSRALRETAGATRSSKQRLREAYDMTYDYKNQGGGGKVVDFGSLK
jgi:hypothetical protein